MNISILYRPNSEHERVVTDFQREYERRSGKKLELTSLDTIEGSEKAKLYDITIYPAILATDDQGRLHKAWQGDRMPLIDEIQAYSIS